MEVQEEIQAGYKQTVLGLLPETWIIKKLEEIGTFKNGINKDKEDFGFGFSLINLSDVLNNSRISQDFQIESLVNVRDRELKLYNLKAGDILFVRSSVKPSGVGLTSLIAEDLIDAVYSGFLIRFRDDGSLNSGYKAFCFHEPGFRNRLINKSTISANTNINQEALKKLTIAIPPLPEQKAIADCLTTWDNAIEKLSALVGKKELQKKALMQQLLTGRKRLKGFGGEWKEYHLGELFKERTETGNLNLQLLSIGQNGVYPQSESTKKDTSNEDKSKYKKIRVGDIGYNTMRMWQGRSALSGLEGIVSPAYTIVTPKNTADSQFFAYLFKTPKATNLFWRNSQGLVDDTLNCKYKDFAIVKFVLPEKKEQKAIAAVLQQADKEIILLQMKLDKFKQQKKGLMQVLLTGKKRLKYE